jgi:RecB family exonuclease
VRVPDLHSFRQTLVALSTANDARAASAPVVLVPTTGAARQLRRSLGAGCAADLVTREAFYTLLHARMDVPPPRLTPYDRDVIMQSAAREASSVVGLVGAWRLRPGLVAEMLRFYDQLRRQGRNIARFEELVDEALSRDAEHDRGAERMLAQTRLLTAAFRGYEARVRSSGACDEHLLREQLMADQPALQTTHIIVSIADWIADPNGLYLADFDLATRLPGVRSIDIVATEGLLESGFHQRIHEWLPGIEEVEAHALGCWAAEGARPTLLVPADDSGRLVFVHRDREEELLAVAGRARAGRHDDSSLDRAAVVYKRPLPYLYLAREAFGGAGIPYQAHDALPLAAEPIAAALDLVFEFVESRFTRASLVALVRSPHFAFEHEGVRVEREGIAALDRILSDKRYLGGLERLTDVLAMELTEGDRDEGARTALGAALGAARVLEPLLTPAPASRQYGLLRAFLERYQVPVQTADDGPSTRASRAHAALRGALESLTVAHALHDDAPMAIADLAASVRRWIEEHTCEPDASDLGIHLLDDQAARYGSFEEMAVVGLVEGEWPEKPKRNIFYPSSLLASLGWPTERDRRGAAEARFLELLCSPSRTVIASTISLDDETLVDPSSFLEEIPRARLVTAPLGPIGSDETVHAPADVAAPLDPSVRDWEHLRACRASGDDAAFHGQTSRLPGKTWSVSALETYLGCPFKFFAQHIVKLQEEPDDEEVMDPRRQGQFVHDVFEAFFKRWQEDGHLAITPEAIVSARAVFREVVESCLEKLSDTEAALERTRLLGSPAAAGLGEAVFRMEAERDVQVVGRFLEHRLKGEFEFESEGKKRRVSLSGKADRIDLLADGTFRVIDYKLGWPPNKARALQLPIYGLCAEQRLDGYLGRKWTFGEGAYLAFKGPKRVVGLFGSGDERARVLAEAQERLLTTIDAIEAGQFPPSPDDVYRCETCTFAAVCRKDYVGDV